MVVEFSVVPIGRGESLSGLVARVADIVDRSGLPYQITAMGTIVEGDWDEVFSLIRLCHEAMRGEAGRVSTHISVDDRENARGKPYSFEYVRSTVSPWALRAVVKRTPFERRSWKDVGIKYYTLSDTARRLKGEAIDKMTKIGAAGGPAVGVDDPGRLHLVAGGRLCRMTKVG